GSRMLSTTVRSVPAAGPRPAMRSSTAPGGTAAAPTRSDPSATTMSATARPPQIHASLDVDVTARPREWPRRADRTPPDGGGGLRERPGRGGGGRGPPPPAPGRAVGEQQGRGGLYRPAVFGRGASSGPLPPPRGRGPRRDCRVARGRSPPACVPPPLPG